MSETTKGLLAVIVACSVWGLSPAYYKLLTHVPAPDVLAHRTLWSMGLFVGILLIQRRLHALPRAFATPGQSARIVAAACMIACNWGLFIFAIQTDRVTETSLGYYIFPLVSVAFGVVFYAERLRAAQWGAIALAAVAVTILTVGLGKAPWIAMILATTFGFYGLIKRGLPLGPVVSVAAEVLVGAPIAVAWLLWTGAWAVDPWTLALLIGAGPITAGPLILFSYAARRVTMATVGLVQYLNPTLQFFCAVVLFAEPFTDVHQIAFGLIWLALAIYTVTAVRGAKAPAPHPRPPQP